MAEAPALGRAFDQPGDVGHDELGRVARSPGAFPDAHDPEVRHQRREGIVGDLGSRRRDARDQRGLADVGKADQGDVGLQLQLEVEPVLLPGFALLGKGRGAPVVREEAVVALTAEAALGRQPAVARTVEVDQEFALAAVDHGPDRYDDDLVLAPRAVLAFGGAVLAVGRPPKGVVAKSQQRGLIVVGHDPDVAALTAVAAVRTTLGDVGLAAKTDAAGPAVARFGVQLGEIDEGGHTFILRPGPSNPLCVTCRRPRSARRRRGRPVRDARRREGHRVASALVTTDLGDEPVLDAQDLPAVGCPSISSAVARILRPITRRSPTTVTSVMSARTPLSRANSYHERICWALRHVGTPVPVRPSARRAPTAHPSCRGRPPPSLGERARPTPPWSRARPPGNSTRSFRTRARDRYVSRDSHTVRTKSSRRQSTSGSTVASRRRVDDGANAPDL